MSTAEPAVDAFPGWPLIEAAMLDALVVGDDMKLTAGEVAAVIGEMARRKEREAQAARMARRVHAGHGCWASDQGYAACEHPGVEQFLDAAPKRVRRRWWRRA